MTNFIFVTTDDEEEDFFFLHMFFFCFIVSFQCTFHCSDVFIVWFLIFFYSHVFVVLLFIFVLTITFFNFFYNSERRLFIFFVSIFSSSHLYVLIRKTFFAMQICWCYSIFIFEVKFFSNRKLAKKIDQKRKHRISVL